MKYYKVIYALGSNNERIYPSRIKEAVWNTTQYHFSDNVMIGGTDSKIKADGMEVIELTEDEASSLIEEFKKNHPKISEKELLLLAEIRDEFRPARTMKSSKKRSKR